MKDIVIVGAGTAGLTLAYYLCRAGLPVTVIERENEVGGLARTFHYHDQWHFDIGPHRFYAANPLVLNFLRAVQDHDFLEIPRFSSVYFMGYYHKWPLRLKTLTKLPPLLALRAGIDLLRKDRHYKADDASFCNYTLQRYGKTLYQTFFQGYTEKFVGLNAKDIHKDWAKIGIERATVDKSAETTSLSKIFKQMLLPKQSKQTFLYPRLGGIQTFWQLCAQQIEAMGGRIITGVRPLRILTEGTEVRAIVTEQGELPCGHLAWSAPLNELNALLGLPAADLTYRSHIIYNIMLSAPPLHDFQWCYYGSKDLIFSRITNPATFSQETIPEGKGALCLEIACQEGDSLWRSPETLRSRIIEEMVQVGIISSAQQVEDMRCELVANAYPVYHLHYIQELERNDKNLSRWSNVRLLGRTGKFWYNNMDHSIENACDHALSLLQGMQDTSSELQSVVQTLTHPPQNLPPGNLAC